MPFSYSREEKILRNSDYRRVYAEGKSSGAAHFSFKAMRTDLGRIRVGLTVPKRLGIAVTRNRIKRVLRELVRLEMTGMEGSWDLVISVRRTPEVIGYASLRDEFLSLLGRIRGILEKTA